MDTKKLVMAHRLLVLVLVFSTYLDTNDAVPLATKPVTYSPLCKPPTSRCYYQPEDVCWADDDCYLSKSFVGICCPHPCPGYTQCQFVKVKAKPSPTTRQPTKSTDKPTTGILNSTDEPWNTKENVTTETPVTKAVLSTSRKPSTVLTSTEPHTTRNVATTQEVKTTVLPKTTMQTTSKLAPAATTTQTPTTKQEATTAGSSSTKYDTTTQIFTTKQRTTAKSPTTLKITTELPATTPSTTPIATTVPTTTPTTPQTTQLPATLAYKPATTTKSSVNDGVCRSGERKNILFLVDGTAHYRQYPHIVDQEFRQLKQYINDISMRLENDKFMIGVMQFGGKRRPKMEVSFTKGTQTSWLLSRVESMRQFKGTDRKVAEALQTASNKFYELKALYDRHDSQDIIVYITRGYMYLNRVMPEIEILRRKSVKVIAVGVSSSQPNVYLERQLYEVASSIKDVHMAKYKNLASIEENVFKGICSAYIAAGTNSVCGRERKDVYFVIDGSASIDYKNFEKKRNFLVDLLYLLESPKSELNIGMMQFSEKSKTRELLTLGEHLFGTEEKLIRNIGYDNGRRTMLGDALQRFNKTVFNGNGGDRPNVNNVLVVFSDGNAHDLELALNMAESIKKQGVRIITFTVVQGAKVSTLTKMASERNDFVDVDLKNAAFYAQKLAALICPSYKKRL